MRKHFILSTRTLVSKRDVTQSFGPDNTVYVPLAVMEEIEAKYYDQMSERGKIARDTLAYLGSFHIEALKHGVVQKNGSTLKVTTNYNEEEIPQKIRNTECSKLDMRILQTCLGVKKQIPEGEVVVLVSKKDTLRKKAELLGIKAQTFRDELLPEISEQYTGRKTLVVPSSTIHEFREKKSIPVSSVISKDNIKDIYPNMFIEMRCGYESEEGRIFKNNIIGLSSKGYYPYRAIPKNSGQRFMLEALMMDSEIAPLVIIKGPAGTGKTYLSLAAGLDQAIDKRIYPNKIMCSRSTTETGERIGFLPGHEGEKMDPYMRGLRDQLKQLINGNPVRNKKQASNNRSKRKNGYSCQDDDENEKPLYEDGTSFFERGDIQIESIAYIRGRTICDTYIIIDEVQNLTPTVVKTIITRVGTGTKLILMGDPAQIDRADLDERNNGLSYASERMKGDPTCWQITMKQEESVRSELAKRASMLL